MLIALDFRAWFAISAIAYHWHLIRLLIGASSMRKEFLSQMRCRFLDLHTRLF